MTPDPVRLRTLVSGAFSRRKRRTPGRWPSSSSVSRNLKTPAKRSYRSLLCALRMLSWHYWLFGGTERPPEVEWATSTRADPGSSPNSFDQHSFRVRFLLETFFKVNEHTHDFYNRSFSPKNDLSSKKAHKGELCHDIFVNFLWPSQPKLNWKTRLRICRSFSNISHLMFLSTKRYFEAVFERIFIYLLCYSTIKKFNKSIEEALLIQRSWLLKYSIT